MNSINSKGGASLGEIYLARRAGFKDVETMRKAFELIAELCEKHGI